MRRATTAETCARCGNWRALSVKQAPRAENGFSMLRARGTRGERRRTPAQEGAAKQRTKRGKQRKRASDEDVRAPNESREDSRPWPSTIRRRSSRSGRSAGSESGAFRAEADPARPKYYLLEMLPYPSGTLHMGHMRNYTIGDAVARYRRMRGFNVLHPIGWDAFGLPAENAAIKRGIAPREWTNANIAQMKAVCRRFGFSYDWRREISTCEPEYYRWNQWFFLRMLERGLAYRKRSLVNWCPKCQTVLANEQVVDGCCWQHDDTPVEAKEIEQWFLRITQYADALLDDMAELEGGWPERVLVMQRNWIGKSRGTRVRFPIAGEETRRWKCSPRAWTRSMARRGHAFAGASAAAGLFAGRPGQRKHGRGVEPAAAADCSRARTWPRRRRKAFSPGASRRIRFPASSVPIWVANFVLAEYGTGAVMAVPAHDQRDFEFAQKYKMPFRVVIQPAEGAPLDADQMTEAYRGIRPAGGFRAVQRALQRGSASTR